MRIVTDFANFTVDPLATPQYGQVEDYGIILSTVLPVDLTELATVVRGADVDVEWSVAQEIDVDHYRVEHSYNGRSWTEAGTVLAKAGNQDFANYSFTHRPDADGTHYYRITSVDYDGSQQQSEVVSAEIRESSTAMRVYPNPIQGRDVTVDLGSTFESDVLRVVNAVGQLVIEQRVDGGRYHTLPTSSLAAGTYTVRTQNENTPPLKLTVLR